MINNINKRVINKKYLLLETMADDIARLILRNKKVNKVDILIKKPKAIVKGKYTGISISRKK